MKLQKNDTVTVLRGKDRGKKGKLLRLFPEKAMAIVEGVNNIRKHMRPTRDNPKGGIIVKEAPIRLSNVMLICPRCSQKARVGFLILSDGVKKRICKKCKEIL
ncbi:MAG TPA: 50S ribosomal protein L24 [Candidatus Omnitrophota bacterium]|nr:50S ribosomal protein L24 [Candidatus Omnitrophota bacterium]